jgi:hypothetical protein
MARDNAGNNSNYSVKSTFTFIVDLTTPTSVVTFPANNSFLSGASAITGSADDSVENLRGYTEPGRTYESGIASTGVLVALQRLSDNKWWDGSSFASNSMVWKEANFVGFSSGTWSYSISTTAITDGTTYYVMCRAIDKAGNYQISWTTNFFTGDMTLPVSIATYPTGTVDSVSRIGGTASDTPPGELRETNGILIALRKTSGIKQCYDPNLNQFTNCPTGTYPNDRIWFTTGTVSDVKGQPASWWWDTSRINWINYEDYDLQAVAIDKAGNQRPYPGENSPDITFKVVTPQADTVITKPAQEMGNYNNGNLGSVQGTGTNLRAINSVEIHLKRLREPASYWYEPTQSWVNNDTYTFVNAFGSDWAMSISANAAFTVDNSSYQFIVRGWNASNEQEDPPTIRTFIVDNTKPIATITQPNYVYTNYLSTISGTAYDPGRTDLPEAYVYGMDKVYLRIKDVGAGTYFNGTNFVSGVQEILANNDSINANVLYWSTSTKLNDALLDGKNYRIFARPVDKAGNYEATENNLVSFEIVYDTTPPSSVISTPTNMAILNDLSYIGGTANDPAGANSPNLKSDLKQVELQIYDEIGAKWWYHGDGQFSVLGSSFNIVSGTDVWTYSHPNLKNSLISNRYYILNSRAIDRAGNTQNGFVVGQSSITFIWDKTPPTSTINFPVSSGTYKPSNVSGPNAFNGTATDTPLPFHGVKLSQVELNLSYIDGNTTYYWRGSAFSSNTIETEAWFSAIGTDTWRYPFDGEANFVSDKLYTLKSRAYDWASPNPNVENPPKEVKFIIDGTPPVSYITTPTPGGYLTHIDQISGTSYGGLSGLQDLRLRIYYYDGADAYYWNGNNQWSSTTITNLPVNFTVSADTITWSYPPVGYNPPSITINNKQYYIAVFGTDKAGNVETPNPITVTSDFNYPTIVISTPMSGANAFYGPSRTLNPISGQADDTPAGIVTPIKIQVTNISESGAVKPKWDGSNWSVVDSTYVAVSGINPWSYTLSNWVANKKYKLDVWAIDYAGNQTPDGTYRRYFIYDTNKPSSTITSFNTGFRKLSDISTIGGNSVDWVINPSTEAMSGIKPDGIFIQIADITGKTFNGSGFATGDNWRNVSTVSVSGITDADIGVTIYSSMTWTYPGTTGDNWPTTLELTEGVTYYVRVRAIDRSQNLENYIEKSFIYDNTPPTVSVSTPADNKAYVSLPYISGVVNEPVSYLPSDGVQVLIQRDADGAYWNGSSWDSSYNPLIHWRSATEIYKSSWVYTDTNLTNYFSSLASALRFKVFVRAKDIAGNITTPDNPPPSTGYNLFTIDKWAPVSITTYPALGNGATVYLRTSIDNIAGTANEVESGYPSGVGEVYVKIIRRDKNNNPCYYSLLSNDWVNTDQGYLVRNAGTVNNWIRTIDPSAFKGNNTGNCYNGVDKGDGFKFEVISYAKDRTEPVFGGPNIETNYSTATFIIDYTTPTASINDNNTYFKTKTQISGTATDLEVGGGVVSGLNNIVIDLRDIERNKYWDFNSLSWSDVYVSTTITTGLSNWVINSVPLNDNSANSWSVGRGSATFEVRAKVIDSAGNYLDFELNKTTFTLDIILPTSTITYPDVENGDFLPFTQITGTADDFVSGISTVQIRIQQDTNQGADCTGPSYNGQYFNGNAFQSGEIWLGVSSYNSGTKQWIYNIDPTKLKPLCYYVIKSSAADNVGNAQDIWGSRRFKFAPPPAVTSITQPPNNAYQKQISFVSGTANSNTKSVNLYIKRNSDGWWWNFAGSFTSTKVSTSVTPSGGSWSYSASLPTFIDGSSYTFISEGINFYDVPETTPLENLVFFDTTPPNVSITIPDGVKQYYNSISTFSGTATDPPGTKPPASGINNVFVELKALNGDYAGKFWDNTLSTFTATWSELNNKATYYITGSSWSYTISIPTAALLNGVKYSVRVKARDNSYKDNLFEGNDSAFFGPYTFNYDITTPTATITSISNGQARSDISIASGTILEDLVLENIGGYPSTQIEKIELYLKNNNLNQYWNGSGWSSDSNTYVLANIYQSSWSVSSMPFWTDNYTYTFFAKAYDKAGNIQTNFVVGSSSHTIRIDKLYPIVSISTPITGGKYSVFPTISGSVSDQNPDTASGISGASNIQISVSYVDGNTTYYFDGASSFVNTLNETNSFFNATSYTPQGPSSGTWIFNPSGLSQALVPNKIYRIRARAQDNAIPIPNPSDLMMNVTTNYNIIYDTMPPNSTIVIPVNGSTLNVVNTIAGNVSDNLSGVSNKSQISVSICEIEPAGLCWNGVVPGTFTVASEVFYPLDYDASLNGSYVNGVWQINAPVFRDGYKYRIRVKACDNAVPTNCEINLSSITFVYDITSPSIVINKPINNRYYGVNVSSVGYYLDVISGTASDTFGVDKTEIQLYDVVTSSYWYNTGGWIVGASSFNYAGSSIWSYPTPPLSDGQRYRLEVRSYDIAGNLSPYVTYYFYYDATPPVVSITKPGNNYWYNSVDQIEGIANDPNVGTFPSGMYHVYSAIQINPPTGLWWDGSGFNSSNEVWLVENGGSWPNWILTGVSTPTWQSNVKYRVKAQGYDVARNTSSIYSVDFVYDTQIPTITVMMPDISVTHYSSISWISGTSSDTNDLGQVDRVELRVKNLSNNGYWQWSSMNYTGDETSWFVVGTTNNYANWYSSGTPGGGITFTNGIQYEINFRVFDKAGNYTTTYTTRTFVYDIGKPTGSITNIGGNLVSSYHSVISPISGNASDTPNVNASGLATLVNGGSQIRILDVESGRWWNYIDNEFNIIDGESAWFNGNSGTSENWVYSNANLNSKAINGHRYLIQYRGKDKSTPANIGPSSNGLDSNFTVGRDSITITYDITPPQSTITLPVNGSTVNVVNYIAGTATDTISGIASKSQISLSICEIEPAGLCWNGVVPGTFTVANEVFYPLDYDASLNGSYVNGVWQINAPVFRDGYKYRIRVKACDNAVPTNCEVNLSSITFVYDTTPPNPILTYPISLPDSRGNINVIPTISGNVYEAFTIDYASIAIQEADTLNYYDPQTSTFNSTTAKWIGATITGTGPNYNFSVLSPNLSDNKNYNIYVKAGDKAGNSKIGDATVVIRYDITPPSSNITFPVDGEFYNFISSVTGWSNDPNTNPSGVKNTQIRIQQLFGNNYYWNGTQWVSAETWLSPVNGNSWIKSDQLPPNNTPFGFEDNGLYEIKSRAFDIAGNTQTVLLSGSVFRFDTSSPTATIDQPLNGYRYNSLTSIYGVAQDTYNVRFPLVRIYDIALNAYWNGSIWAKDTNDDPRYPEIWHITNSSSSTGEPFIWNLDVSTINWPDRDNGLRVDVKVIDRAGNYNIFSSTFSFDKTPPITQITYPPVNDNRYSSMTAINGTVLDMTSNINSVYIRIWYLSNGTTYYFYPASPHWSQTDPGWWSVAGTNNLPKGVINNWSYTNPDFTNPGNLNFVWKESTHDGKNGKKFYIAARSIDMTTNVEVNYTTRTFIFDNEGPLTSPTFPESNSSYNNVSAIVGSLSDDSPINWIKVSILDEDATKYFDGSGFNSNSEVWLDVSNIYTSSWVYNNGLLSYINGHHYVIRSSATDIVGNIQTVPGSVRFLFETTEPNSYVAIPQNALVYNDDRIILGNSSDPGYIHQGINGTGSGVYPYASWAKGKTQVCVFRDTEPLMGISGPVTFGAGTGWDSTGYFWNGSTWVAVSEGPVWVDAVYTDQLGNWSYDGLVCDNDTERQNHTCWVKGYPYHIWVRARDNANNLQSIIASGPRFYIAAPARSFLVTFSSSSFIAGSDIDISVEAKDGDNGTGARAAAYQGRVEFYVDGVPGGPETMDTDYILDDIYGLPPTTQFQPSDYGFKTFKVRLRKAGIRALRVQDKDNPNIYGSAQASVSPSDADRISIISDYDILGEQPDPGTQSGKKGIPREKYAGNSVTYLLQVTDKYWNVVMSSTTMVNISDDDPNNDSISPNINNFVFTGTTTITRVFVSANSIGWKLSATGAGTYPNNNNPSSPVVVKPNPADRLLVVLPGETVNQGKFSIEPKGKDGVPNPQRAGVSFNVDVYSVDQYYNIVSTDGIQVWVDIPSDKYYTKQSTKTLVSGTTSFTLTPVVASTHNIYAYTLQLSNTYYVTPNPVKVWWNTPTKLQILAEGEFNEPGKPPYDSNPTTGGRIGTKLNLTAGVTSYVTVNLVDDYFNIVKGTTPWLGPANNNPVIKVDFLNDSNIVARGLVPNPYTKSLINGSTTFAFIPVTRNQTTGLSIRATDTGETGTNYSTDTLSGIIVNPNNPVSLMIYVPGETPNEGSISGKLGTPSILTAGTTYQLLVRSVDLYNNKSPDGRSVRITANDIYADLPSPAPLAGGERLFDGFVPSASTGNLVINAIDNDSITPKLATSTVSGISVVPGPAVRLMWKIPDQYLVAGKTTYPYGVDGIVSTQTAGVGFDAYVYAVDSRYNPTSVSARTIRVTSDDPFYQTVGNFTMSGGSATITGITFRTASPRKLTATDLTGSPPLISATSIDIPVKPNTPTKLRVLLPGESRLDGDNNPITRGRTGTPSSTLKAGETFYM